MFDQDIVSVQAVVRRRDHYFEPCAAIFEYEDPSILGTMDVCYAPAMWLRSAYYGADEFFEIQGDEGFLWVTRCTGQMLDLPAVVLYDGATGRARPPPRSRHVDDDWGTGFRRASHPLHRHTGRRRAGRDERRRGGQGPPALLRRLRGRQHPAGRSTPDRSPIRWSPTGGPGERHPDPPPQRQRRGAASTMRRLLPGTAAASPTSDRPAIPGVGGHWFAAGRRPAPPGGRRRRARGYPAYRSPRLLRRRRPRRRHRRARARTASPTCGGPRAPDVQIWFADPAGNTIEIQQDPDLSPPG